MQQVYLCSAFFHDVTSDAIPLQVVPVPVTKEINLLAAYYTVANSL